MTRIFCVRLAFALLCAFMFPLSTSADIILAADDSADAVYTTGGWTSGDNGGSGFNAWVLRHNSDPGLGGVFQGSATDNNDGASSAGGTINTSGDSFGIYANNTNQSAAYRAFNLLNGQTQLLSGYTFNWSMDSGLVSNGSSTVGLTLRNGNSNAHAGDSEIFAGQRFGFEHQNQSGQDFYTYYDSTGTHNTGIATLPNGVNLSLTLTSLNSYSLRVTNPNSGNALLGTFTGSFLGTVDAPINSFVFYNRNAGTNAPNNAYFNSFSVSAVPEVTPMLAIPVAVFIAAAIGVYLRTDRPRVEVVKAA